MNGFLICVLAASLLGITLAGVVILVGSESMERSR